MPLDAAKFPQTAHWYERARRVIPGGIYGHVAPAATVPGGVLPYFAVSGHGARYRDIEGREFIDFMCGYGPLLLGHSHPEVEEAVSRARAGGVSFNHPTEWTVRLAEALVERIDFAAWAVLAKNGSDLTTWAVRVAREATGRAKIVKIRGAYHGSHAWCSPGFGGLLPEDRAQVEEVGWNDEEALTAVFERMRGRIAGVIVTPFHHPAFADLEEPKASFVATVQRLCRAAGALLVLDDVRCFPRLHAAGSHRRYGWEPDLAVYCKAIGNGHAIAAAVGREEIRVAASRVFLTGSYWYDPGPMAAAWVTMQIAERERVPEVLEERGRRWVAELVALGEREGVALTASGPGAMPYVRIARDEGFAKTQWLCVAAAEEGVFLHPHHNWFLSLAHSSAELQEALERLGRALRRVRERCE